ncbi:PQQ-dependent sugar dehydrogenase [Paracraurococcus lichenis]|uniref:PQQ-dependent sugar dehydrogenase n=1 Tax=Paracraurococcus lichenis TaxID=3064888 RepID=A0ABT9EBM1_9PROT|nr:PQQ-dependent sugar dehydrogenase [Paracraurococcus sp. LOR1-02]MDO9713612.1 PQQ-dependent sugar dehydrogenase [Paracraurococcus sp. LOR1-02]
MAAALPVTIEALRVSTRLSEPLFATAPASDPAHLFVVEKGGRIESLDLATGTLAPSPFLDLSGTISTAGEEGLLGLAFHPDFGANGRFFVYLSNTIGDTEVREYRTLAGDPSHADPASGRLVLGIDQPDGLSNHKGGWIGFGPDVNLYIGTGDGGGAGDPFGNAQNTGSLLGKMLRIDVDGPDAYPADLARNYAIPEDNPFIAGGGAPEVWDWGLRNPWRASFDRVTGELWIGDVGQSTSEEIDLGVRGANYGWNRFEGSAPYLPGAVADASGLTPPVFAYGRDLGFAVTGGYVYRGPGETLQGAYVFADFGSGHVFALTRDSGAGATVKNLTNQLLFAPGQQLNAPSSFGEDALGHLYAVDFDGDVFRLVPHGGSVPGSAGDVLFDSTFYLAANPDVAQAGVDPREHYHLFGWREGRDPSPGFNTSAYLANYPDVAAAGVDPLEHYLAYGRAEGRMTFADAAWM